MGKIPAGLAKWQAEHKKGSSKKTDPQVDAKAEPVVPAKKHRKSKKVAKKA